MIKALRKLFAATPEACPSCELCRKAMISLHDKLQITAKAQASLARRASNLAKDHPELWRLYFTKAGETEREASGGK